MSFYSIVYILTFIVIAYLIGSFPTGYLLVKAIKGEDIRQIGSGSTGATNVKRVLGAWAFFVVMFIDGLKGLIPVLLAKYVEVKFNLFPSLHLLPVLASVAVILGHSKSVFLGFKGGKSVASGVGTIFGLYWVVGLITAILWSLITYTTRMVSISSIIVVLLTALWMWLFKQPLSYVIYCLVGGLYITWLHRENIQRLIAGTENKVR